MGKVAALCQEKFSDYIAVVSFSILIALCAYVRIPLFFTPVPLVIQNSLAVLFGAALGSKRGALAVFLFIVYGCLNMPVFASGKFGLAHLLSPTGGYVIGYLIAAYVTGKIVEMNSRRTFLAVLLGHLIILMSGYLLLSQYLGWEKGYYLGVVPFIGMDVLKSVVVAKIAQKLQKNRGLP